VKEEAIDMATAKPTFAKMGLKMNTDVKMVKIGEQEIEVKQYLPVNDKLILIGKVISSAADDNNFSNPIKLDVFTSLEIVFAYTNIVFTDKQKEDLIKLYDIMECNGIFDEVIAAIPQCEYKSIIEGVEECSNAIYTYRNSVMGVLEMVGQDYSQLQFDSETIRQQMADPNNLALLKGIMDKLA
jgi:hypothetical protein